MEITCAGLVNDSIVDGPGLRFVVFAQGCPHHCRGCHNPSSHPLQGGTPYTTEELFQKIAANPLLSGVTFSGGEPFCQPEAFSELAARVRTLPLEIAAYTGYTMEALLEMAAENPAVDALLHHLDVLIDGPFLEDARSLELHFRGSSNQRTIDVPASLAAGHPVQNHSPRWN